MGRRASYQSSSSAVRRFCDGEKKSLQESPAVTVELCRYSDESGKECRVGGRANDEATDDEDDRVARRISSPQRTSQLSEVDDGDGEIDSA